LNQRGFTLIELLIGMVVTAILGIALARILISDSRFVGKQDAMINARHASRAAMNTMVTELRMAGDGGLLAATPDSVRVLVPYAFGLTCTVSGTDLIASLMPPDSLMYGSAVTDGLAWRDSAGAYNMIPGIVVAGSSNVAACQADSIRVVPGGMLVAISGISGTPPQPGRIFYLYQTVTYKFAASTDITGRIGLWRKAGTAAAEELVAPFDSTAGFACLVGPNLQIQTCPPGGGLALVRGLELRMFGASEHPPPGSTTPETFSLVTQVPFLNKVN